MQKVKQQARKLLIGAAFIGVLVGGLVLGPNAAVAHAPIHPHEIGCTLPLPPCF